MVTLANLYRHQGRYDEAETLFHHTLNAQKRVLGDHHQHTGLTLYDLACLEAQRGNPTKALDWLRQAVESGFSRAKWMLTEPAPVSLHGPEFDSLVERTRLNGEDLKAK